MSTSQGQPHSFSSLSSPNHVFPSHPQEYHQIAKTLICISIPLSRAQKWTSPFGYLTGILESSSSYSHLFSPLPHEQTKPQSSSLTQHYSSLVGVKDSLSFDSSLFLLVQPTTMLFSTTCTKCVEDALSPPVQSWQALPLPPLRCFTAAAPNGSSCPPSDCSSIR